MRKYKIIIVENDEDEQLFMNEGFNSTGLFDIQAMLKNGDVLYDWLTNHPDDLPEIILSDLNMPGKNGYDIIADVRSNPAWSEIPVIITSTSSTKTIMDKCFAAGATEYVVKPETFVEYAPFAMDLYKLIEKKQLVS